MYLHCIYCRSTQHAINEWIDSRFSDMTALGKVELMFCPFIKWFDRHIEEILTEALREYRRELMAAAAGVQFISATSLREQYSAVTDSQDEESQTDGEEEDEDSEDEESDYSDKGELPQQPGHIGEMPPESGHDSYHQSATAERKGTEVKLRELQLSENAATLLAKKIKAVVVCGRCKDKTDVTMSSQRPVQVSCAKCSQGMIVAFRSNMAHQFSSVIGYMDVSDCQAFDIVLLDCVFDIGCFNCNKEVTIEVRRISKVQYH